VKRTKKPELTQRYLADGVGKEAGLGKRAMPWCPLPSLPESTLPRAGGLHGRRGERVGTRDVSGTLATKMEFSMKKRHDGDDE